MTRAAVRAVALVVAVALAGACGGDDDRVATEQSTTTQPAPPSSTTTATTVPPAPATTTMPPTTQATVKAGEPTTEGVPGAGILVVGPSGATLARNPGGTVYTTLRSGVVVPFDAVDGDWARVLTPCDNSAWTRLASGRVERAADVVLDAGHGGVEPGAVGPTGLTEKELNLDVARRAADVLRAEGVDVVLTRPDEYRITIATRVAIATALRPKAFVSIHHNAEPDGPRDGPGSEIYYQIRSGDSKRLAGLLYEEAIKALSPFPADWVADRDAGAKYRPSSSGGDYYGILRRSAEKGVVATLAELAFISNPTEEALLRRDDVRQAEAESIARGVLRFLRTGDPGSGFVEPYPRVAPAGPGGGSSGCDEPVL